MDQHDHSGSPQQQSPGGQEGPPQQPPPGYQQGPPRWQDPNIKRQNDERLWATFCHLAAFAGYIGVPLGNIVGPLIVWLIKRNEYLLVDDQGKQALNFQISMAIYVILCIPLILVLIGIPLLIAIAVIDLVFTIIAAVRANRGEAYRYPLAIQFLK